MILDGSSIDKVNMQNPILGRVSLEKKLNFPPFMALLGDFFIFLRQNCCQMPLAPKISILGDDL